MGEEESLLLGPLRGSGGNIPWTSWGDGGCKLENGVCLGSAWGNKSARQPHVSVFVRYLCSIRAKPNKTRYCLAVD